VLEDVGLVVEQAENGQVCVDMAHSRDFDLILLDMQMPVMDGYAAAGILREKQFTKPVIALTADAMKGFEQKCLAAGCSGYLTKPINIDSLIETLAELLGGERRSGEGIAKTPVASPVPAIEAGPVLSSLGGKSRQYTSIIRRFVGRLEERLEVIQADWDARNFDEIAAHAHWLKGSAGTVGFEVFCRPAEALELFARTRNEADIDGVLREIRELADRIVVDPNVQAGPVAAARENREPVHAGAVLSTLASNPKFRPTVEKFVGRLERNLHVMDHCLETRDYNELGALAHWLKGSSGMVGFKAFSGPAKNLEGLARDQKWSEIEPLLLELHSLADRIEIPAGTSGNRSADREEPS
jgi:CheY-like chemotaxis protein/HPt (histidine-containing phosphotransfer) domain-containing protein